MLGVLYEVAHRNVYMQIKTETILFLLIKPCVCTVHVWKRLVKKFTEVIMAASVIHKRYKCSGAHQEKKRAFQSYVSPFGMPEENVTNFCRL